MYARMVKHGSHKNGTELASRELESQKDEIPSGGDSDSDCGSDGPSQTQMGKLNLIPDTASCVILALIKRHDKRMLEELGTRGLWMGLINAAVVHFLTICMQLYIMFMLYVFVIERREDPFERKLEEKEAMLMNAVTTGIKLNTTDPESFESALVSQCYRDHTVKYAQSFLVFLWLSKILVVVLECFWYSYIAFLLPDTDEDAEDILLTTESETLIQKLSCSLRNLITWGVNLPRVMVTLMIAVIGVKFLVVANTLGVLILKSVALVFVVEVDKVVCAAYMHFSERSLIAKTKFHYREIKYSKQWSLWGSTVAKFLGVVMMTLLFTRVVFRNYAEFRTACAAYESMFQPFPKLYQDWSDKPCKTCGFQLGSMHFQF